MVQFLVCIFPIYTTLLATIAVANLASIVFSSCDIPLNISYTDLQIATNVSSFDNNCTSTPWINYNDNNGSGKIILWKSNPDESYFPQMECIFCYDTTISGTYSSGYPLEYNSYNPGANLYVEHVTDLNNWIINDETPKRILTTGQSLTNIYSFLGIDISGYDFTGTNTGNYGTPLDINSTYSTDILSGWCDDFTVDDKGNKHTIEMSCVADCIEEQIPATDKNPVPKVYGKSNKKMPLTIDVAS